jgi:hypothetical protein
MKFRIELKPKTDPAPGASRVNVLTLSLKKGCTSTDALRIARKLCPESTIVSINGNSVIKETR